MNHFVRCSLQIFFRLLELQDFSYLVSFPRILPILLKKWSDGTEEIRKNLETTDTDLWENSPYSDIVSGILNIGRNDDEKAAKLKGKEKK